MATFKQTYVTCSDLNVLEDSEILKLIFVLNRHMGSV